MANYINPVTPTDSTGAFITAANPLQVSGVIGTSAGAYQTPSGTVLTANTDTSFTFSPAVKHVFIQNKSATDVYFELDAAATVGGPVLPAAQGNNRSIVFFDVPVTVVHLLSVPATNVNGTADLNIVVRGWA